MPKKNDPNLPEALNETPNAVFVVIDDQGVRHEYPYRNRQTMVDAAKRLQVRLAVIGWLTEIDLNELIALWFEAQGIKQARLEAYAKSAADPDSMVGKSPEYVYEYWKARKEAAISSSSIQSDS